MSLEVRPACAQDWPQMRQIFLLARRQAFHWLDGRSFDLRDLDAETRGERLWVALDRNRQVLGFIALWAPTGFIHHLYVDPARRRRGVGQALLQSLPEWGRVRYSLKCLRRNAPALAFYAALGFTEGGLGEAPDADYVVLEAPLLPACAAERPEPFPGTA